MKTIILIETNLFFSQKIGADLRRLGYEARVEKSFAGVQENVKAGVSAVIVDLAARGIDPVGIIKSLKGDSQTSAIPVIGFCGHADQALMEAARAAGCNLVTTNGKISSDLSGLLNQAVT